MYIKILIWIYKGYSTKTFISQRVPFKQCTTKTVLTMCSREQFEEKLKQIQFAINVLKSIDDSRLRSERMEQLINELFKLEFFKKIPQPPPRIGIFITKYADITITVTDYSFNVASRIIGPCGSTIKAISRFSRCQLKLVNPNENPLRIKLIAKGYENIANWRIHKAIEGIQYVLTNDQYEVSLNQLAELAVRRGIHEKSLASYRYQVKTFLSHSGVVNVENEEDQKEEKTNQNEVDVRMLDKTNIN
ncbi:putative KH domain protein [Trichinella spiralis]|uniref:putative KH domain protein n=1 Tax=Trichinella spiralis TaxID=6334 RepID=UPI0001EFE100|nr:putative KH domain protein [Trichinella spiralis]